MVYSTHMGGSTGETARTCFLGPDGALYLAGQTVSTNWPTRHAADITFGGGDHPFAPGSGDAFVAKFCRTDDFDGDGQTDIAEFITGTSTLDAQDFFAVNQLWQDPTGSHVTVTGQRGAVLPD